MSGTNGRRRRVVKVTATKLSPAVDVGDCWLCGRGLWWHRLLGWLLCRNYDPIRKLGGAEIKRLDEKYRKGH